MNLLKTLLIILSLWRPAFCKNAGYIRSKEQALASLCSFGKKTITSMSIFLGRSDKLPIADYKFYTEYNWNVQDLFNPILYLASQYIEGEYLTVAIDDTKIHKTGKKIPHASWHCDPLGPKFQTNLIWALRYLQMSVIMPHSVNDNTPSRAIPIRFTLAPHIKKPGKKASQEDMEKYKEAIKETNMSKTFVQEVKDLRDALDKMNLQNKILIISTDGSFCNKTCMNIEDSRVIMISRCRKDAKLCFRSKNPRKIYDDIKFTPEEIRQNDTIQWQKGNFFYGGKLREMKYKEVKQVLWENGTKRKELRLIVLAPLPYIRGGRRNYRDPAYLLTDSLTAPVEVLIQSYLDRWQIEYNHRDEKSILGVGEAQVRNPNAIHKQPAFHVATYSALLLANFIAYKDKDHMDFGPRPKWRKQAKRNTCRALIGLLRSALIENPEILDTYGIKIANITDIFKKAA